MSRNKKHDSLVELILKEPSIVGLEDVISAETEVECYENGCTYCVPDIVFNYGEDLSAIVEVKSNSDEKCLTKLKDQLKRGYKYFLKYFGKKCRTIGAYLSNDKVKVIEYDFGGAETG